MISCREAQAEGWCRNALKKRFLADVASKRKGNDLGAEYPADFGAGQVLGYNGTEDGEPV
jgi:hypothetical protein